MLSRYKLLSLKAVPRGVSTLSSFFKFSSELFMLLAGHHTRSVHDSWNELVIGRDAILLRLVIPFFTKTYEKRQR
jgi:hypothetical protein